MNGNQPIFVLSEDSLRTMGKDAQRGNIAAGRTVAESVRTTLGPRGMDKMLVDSLGDVVITNDGVTILEEMEIEHPAAKMIVEVSKTQNEQVGDGTTTAVVIAGELLKKAEDLLEKEIHPTIIINGFRLAKQKALETVEGIAKDITLESDEELLKIAMTAMTGKGSEAAKDELARLSVDAVRSVAESSEGTFDIDASNIKLQKQVGGSIDNTELVSGIVIDKERVNSGMPGNVNEAKIALLDTSIEVKETETEAKINITSPEQLQSFIDSESKMLKEMVEKVTESGANVLFCQKGIDDIAQHYLAKKGILAVRRVKKSDIQKLSKATGAKVVSNIEDLTKDDLGFAGTVKEQKVSGDSMIFVKDCKEPKAVTILIRGGTEHVVAEVERAIEDAIKGVIAAIEVGKVVAGGGSPEIEISQKLSEYADSVGGREQLAIDAFAEALEVIPRTLAESAGLDAIDTIVSLRSKHESGDSAAGVDVTKTKITNMWDLGVIEPLKIKTQAIKSASEAAEMILRIDDVVSASGKSKNNGGNDMPPMPPGGGMGGMPMM